MYLLEIRDVFRIVKTLYNPDMTPSIEIPIEWAYRDHDDADNAIDTMATNELTTLLNNITNPNPNNGLAVQLNFNGEHIAEIGIASPADKTTNRVYEPFTQYDIYHVERCEFYDDESKKRYFWKYRDMKIYPNKKNNRFRVYDDMGFKFLRHSIEAALTSIDILRLMERIRQND